MYDEPPMQGLQKSPFKVFGTFLWARPGHVASDDYFWETAEDFFLTAGYGSCPSQSASTYSQPPIPF